MDSSFSSKSQQVGPMYLTKNLPALKNLQILLHLKNGREKCK